MLRNQTGSHAPLTCDIVKKNYYVINKNLICQEKIFGLYTIMNELPSIAFQCWLHVPFHTFVFLSEVSNVRRSETSKNKILIVFNILNSL